VSTKDKVLRLRYPGYEIRSWRGMGEWNWKETNSRKLDFIPLDLKGNIISGVAGNADGR
jgi:hypothetical protein